MLEVVAQQCSGWQYVALVVCDDGGFGGGVCVDGVGSDGGMS